jgi:hypothetical protein
MIYYIACTATQRLKIGYTRGEPEVRLKQLQTGSAAELRLIACHDGTQDDERCIHSLLAAYRIRGEWFEASDEVLAFLSLCVREVILGLIDRGQQAPQWAVSWLLALQENNGFLPSELRALV